MRNDSVEKAHDHSLSVLKQELELLRDKKQEAMTHLDDISDLLGDITEKNEKFRYEESIKSIKSDLNEYINEIREI